MKKKITLVFTLILSVVALFSTFITGASASEAGWSVTVQDASVVKGSSVSVNFSLKYGNDVVEELIGVAIDGTQYTVAPIVKIYDGENVFANATGNVIDAKDMGVGEKTLTIKLYNTYDELLAQSDFKLTVTKKDNTMTIVFIVIIALMFVYMIWSNYSNKKKAKKEQAQARPLNIGDRVKTIGGICGFVSEINDAENTFTLEVGSNSYVKFDKGAIYQTAPANGSASENEKKDK